MASLDPPSTLKPAQVAVAMIESGVAKHRTRGDLVFFKSVRPSPLLRPSRREIDVEPGSIGCPRCLKEVYIH